MHARLSGPNMKANFDASLSITKTKVPGQGMFIPEEIAGGPMVKATNNLLI